MLANSVRRFGTSALRRMHYEDGPGKVRRKRGKGYEFRASVTSCPSSGGMARAGFPGQVGLGLLPPPPLPSFDEGGRCRREAPSLLWALHLSKSVEGKYNLGREEEAPIFQPLFYGERSLHWKAGAEAIILKP